MYGLTRQAFYKHFDSRERLRAFESWILQLVRQIRKRLPQSGGNNLWRLVQRLLRILKLKPIGRDHLACLLRRHNLQVGRRRRRRVKTTYSGHSYAVQPNLLHDVEASGPGQVLVADITYISVANASAYLFLVTDAFSRMIVGYYLSDSLSHYGAVAALNMALKHVSDPKGVVHHSDRGVQYCCHDFIDEIRKWDLRSSMTDADHCAQNALAECMNGILKSEFFLDMDFLSFSQASAVIRDAVFTYNHLRIHGSLERRTPAEVHYGADGCLETWAKQIFSLQFPSLSCSAAQIPLAVS
jgi:transposase InsO family protein